MSWERKPEFGTQNIRGRVAKKPHVFFASGRWRSQTSRYLVAADSLIEMIYALSIELPREQRAINEAWNLMCSEDLRKLKLRF